MKRIYIIAQAFTLLSLFIVGCEDFVDVGLPNTRLTSGAVFSTDATASAAALGMYESMLRGSSFGTNGTPASVATITGIYSDELVNYYSPNVPFAQNTLTASNTTVLSIWSSAYYTIYTANALIEGLDASSTVTSSLKDQLVGEALFVRAFCHFYLTNLFGDIPLVLSTDYRNNGTAPRKEQSNVYEQIIHDIEQAAERLGQSYISAERARPSAWSAKALLARVYLFTGKWAEAETTATEIIDHTSLFQLEPDLANVFLKNSLEAIWQLSSTTPTSYNTYEGSYFILTTAPQVHALSQHLLNAFEPYDQRRFAWVGSFSNGVTTFYYPFKYKVKGGSNPLQEHSIVLRLAEQYLIRAEARARLGKLSGDNSAAADINIVRARAALAELSFPTEDEALLAVEKERYIELFSEWGHRWLDIKRMGKAEAILSPIKPQWEEKAVLFPIPESELISNPQLKPQNPGY
ncbi:MAG: RagB/SusD family nutrient uptake outer membrane protein [Cyclobacteriaceae bacterium]